MWEQYQKHLIPTQVFIIAMCVAIYFLGKAPLPTVLAVFVVMQLGGLAGAWWGVRLKRKLNPRGDRLPLDKH